MTLQTIPLQRGPATAEQPTVVGIRAEHHPLYDRVEFQFAGGLPAGRSLGYLPTAGLASYRIPQPVPGRAVLRVEFEPAAVGPPGVPAPPSRLAFALPNVLCVARLAAPDGAAAYGIGLAQRQRFVAYTLPSPDRVVVDISAAFPTVQRQVWFASPERHAAGQEPYLLPVSRPVLPLTPAAGVLDRLFAGPTAEEEARGLALLTSGATGFTALSISRQVAHVRLLGACRRNGSVSIADQIIRSLKQFSTVDYVKIHDRNGDTRHPAGPVDSLPSCLEP